MSVYPYKQGAKSNINAIKYCDGYGKFYSSGKKKQT